MTPSYGSVRRDRGRLVAGAAEWDGMGPRPHLRRGPQLRCRNHPAHAGNPAAAAPPRPEADPFHASHAGDPAADQAVAAEVQGQQAEVERGDDAPVQGAGGESARWVPPDAPANSRVDRAVL